VTVRILDRDMDTSKSMTNWSFKRISRPMATLILYVLFCLLMHGVHATCTFPSNFQGTWKPDNCSSILTSDSDCSLLIGPSTVTGLSVTEGDTVTLLDFECFATQDKIYSLRSSVTSLLGYEVRIYLCWEMHDLSGNVFFRQLTRTVLETSPQRGKAHLTSDVTITDFDSCDEDPDDVMPIMLMSVAG